MRAYRLNMNSGNIHPEFVRSLDKHRVTFEPYGTWTERSNERFTYFENLEAAKIASAKITRNMAKKREHQIEYFDDADACYEVTFTVNPAQPADRFDDGSEETYEIQSVVCVYGIDRHPGGDTLTAAIAEAKGEAWEPE